MRTLEQVLNDNQQVTRWPKDSKQRILILDYLHTKFDTTKTYHEQEINEVLKQWHTFQDWPMLRRELVDRHYLSRNISGTEYVVHKIV